MILSHRRQLYFCKNKCLIGTHQLKICIKMRIWRVSTWWWKKRVLVFYSQIKQLIISIIRKSIWTTCPQINHKNKSQSDKLLANRQNSYLSNNKKNKLKISMNLICCRQNYPKIQLQKHKLFLNWYQFCNSAMIRSKTPVSSWRWEIRLGLLTLCGTVRMKLYSSS
jgi:hypothetical protein